MQGTLFKWTNYISGWQPRWFVLDSGILSYYLSPEEVKSGSRGAFKVSSCNIRSESREDRHGHATDNRRIDFVSKSGVHLYVRAATTEDRQQWMVAFGEAKQKEPTPALTPQAELGGVEQFVKSKMADLHRTCQTLVQHVGVIRAACTVSSPPQVQLLEETAKELQDTCDHFLNTLADCMELEEHLRERVSLSSRQNSVPADEGLGQSKQRYVQSVPRDLFFPSSSAVTGVHSPTTPLATPPSPSLKGFSVKELYATSHSLPSPTHAHPSRHDYTKIPSHLVAHTTHSQLAKQTSTHQEENLHTSLPLHLQRMSPSREMGAGEEREEEEEGKGNKSMDGLLTMSRTGSEGFITPESSPRNSRAGTPIVMPPLPIATSAEEDPPQPPARVYETMFSKRPHKFDDFELDNDGHIPTEPFLLACRAILPFFDAISPVTLAPVKVGVNGDITTLYDIHKSNPLQFPTLQSMVLHELRTGTNQTPPPATNAVQWVKRVLEFVHAFMMQIAIGEEDLCVAAGKAYTESLRKYHNWVVRGIFQVGIRTLPYRHDLMVTLGAVEEDWEESHRVVIEDLEAAVRPLYKLLCNLNQFLTEHNLEL